MHAHVALSALILGLAATASAQRLRGRAFLQPLDDDPAPLPSNSGFATASHRRALKKTSADIQQKVVAALRSSVASSSSSPKLATAQGLTKAAIQADGALSLHQSHVTTPLPILPS